MQREDETRRGGVHMQWCELGAKKYSNWVELYDNIFELQS